MKSSKEKGSNSHGNNPPIGTKKQVTLPVKHWEFSLDNFGKYAEGIREMVRLAEVVINQNIRNFCCCNIKDECFPSKALIEDWLLANFPDLETSEVKNHKDLAEEICLGEATIVDGCRQISIVELEVQYQGKRLYEDRQVYKNGRVRSRRHANGDRYLPSEKMFSQENWLDAAIRATREELGIYRYADIKLEGIEKKENPDSAYKGITSLVLVHHVSVKIFDEDYLPEYAERQDGKTTFFVWG